MRFNLKHLISKKLRASGTVNILVGTSVIMLLIMFIYVETLYSKNTLTANFVEDNITTSLLGSALISTEEYGASNQLIIYDLLDNHSHLEDDRYIDYIDGIEFTDGSYYSTYIFDTISDIDTLGNLGEGVSAGISGPEQSYDRFITLLKTNMRLDDNLIPIDSIYLPQTKDGTNPNVVEINTFKVYNYIEFMVKGTNYDSKIVLTKPLLSVNGEEIPSCDSKGDPLFSSYDDLVDNNLIHTKIIEYNIVNGIITDSIVYDNNEYVYITDSHGNTVTNEAGKFTAVQSSGIYVNTSFHVNLGKEKLAGQDHYTLVSRDKMVFIENK